ncbi:MAG: hypothetical protein PHS57_00685 [Alphaproteobacteria bacterium]|nr:hypothetical protein [Alphaproteobacteria bacterium]
MPSSDELGLQNKQGVDFFFKVLQKASGYHENVIEEKGRDQSIYLELDASFAWGYKKAFSFLKEKQPEQLTKKEMQDYMKEVFISGKLSADMRDNVMDLFERTVSALSRGLIPGFSRTAPSSEVAVERPCLPSSSGNVGLTL